MKKTRSAGIILSYANTFLNMLCGLFLSSFLLRSLGDTDYGVYQTISSFANYLVLLEFGTGTVMARNISLCRGKNATPLEIEKNISTIWTVTNILSGIILAVSVLFYALMGMIYANSLTPEQIVYGKKIFIFITAFLILSFYYQTLSGITLAFEHYTFASRISIIKHISRTALLIALVFAFKKAIIIAMVDAFLSLAIDVYTFIYCKKNFKIKINCRNFDRLIFKTSLPLSLAIFIQVIVNQANSNIGKFIIGIKISPEIVALYSVGMYVYSIFSSLTTIPISMYVPQITKSVADGAKGKKLTDILIQPSRLIVIIGGSVLFGFIAAGRQFVSIVYGEKYLQAWLIAIIIMLPMFLNMANGIIINVLNAMNKRMLRSGVLIGTTVLNIILTLIWIDRYGIFGVVAATALCTFLGQVTIMNIIYQKAIGIHVLYMYKETFKGILLYQILGSIAGLIIGNLISNVYISFFISAIIYVIIAFGGFLLFGKNKAEKDLIVKVLSKYRRKQ